MFQSKAGYIDARPLTASSAKPLATHGRTIQMGQKCNFAIRAAIGVEPISRCNSTVDGPFDDKTHRAVWPFLAIK
jgi:hypothetical protein